MHEHPPGPRDATTRAAHPTRSVDIVVARPPAAGVEPVDAGTAAALRRVPHWRGEGANAAAPDVVRARAWRRGLVLAIVREPERCAVNDQVPARAVRWSVWDRGASRCCGAGPTAEAYTPVPKRKLAFYAPPLWRDRVIGWGKRVS